MIVKGNILTADKGKLIMHKDKICANTVIALGKEAKAEDWIEIDETTWDIEKDTLKEPTTEELKEQVVILEAKVVELTKTVISK